MFKEPTIGEMLLDRYRVESVIVRKNDTLLLECIDTRLDVRSAVKLYISDKDNPVDETKAFLVSAKIQAKLKHPNIVHVTNIESRNGLNLVVMELLHGVSLQKYCEQLREPIGESTLYDIFVPIVDALSVAHDSDTLHKNLNPSNIFLNEQGSRYSPRLLNFSPVRLPVDSHETLPYLSPEQLLSFDNATKQSDIFSVGTVLYFLLTGKTLLPFTDRKDYIAFYQSHPAPTYDESEIPETYRHILQKCLRVNPEERYTDAVALFEDIHKLPKPRKTQSMNSSQYSKIIAALPIHEHFDIKDVISQDKFSAVLSGFSKIPNYKHINLRMKVLINPSAERLNAFNVAVQRQHWLSSYSQNVQSFFSHIPQIGIYATYAEPALSLRQSVEAQQYPVQTLLSAFTYVVQALDIAHRSGIFHGHLSPDNIFFVTRNNYMVPVIYDFSQHVFFQTDPEDITFDNAPFIAPELNFALSQAAYPQADIYALGMCFAFALLGRSPFKSTNLQDLKNEIISLKDPPLLRDIRPDLNASIVQVIHWCIAPAPNMRYRSAGELLNDLLRLAQMQ